MTANILLCIYLAGCLAMVRVVVNHWRSVYHDRPLSRVPLVSFALAPLSVLLWPLLWMQACGDVTYRFFTTGERP